MRQIKWKLNTLPKSDNRERSIEFLNDKEITKVKSFMKVFHNTQKHH